MPPFPGMGYPLVPGYEAMGEIVEATLESGLKIGDFAFVPGANCYQEAFGLFGGSARRVVTSANRLTRLIPGLGPKAPYWRLLQQRATRWRVWIKKFQI